MSDSDTPVGALKNLGPQMTAWLEAVGIGTRSELARAGAPMAYLMLRHQFKGINRLALYALFGALEDRHLNSYAPEEKARMTRAIEEDFQVRYEA